MKTKSILSLSLEIPVVETTKEGQLKGGFISFSSVEGTGSNINCPSGHGSDCFSDVFEGMRFDNFNCPTEGARCSGRILQTSTTSQPTGEGINLGMSML